MITSDGTKYTCGDCGHTWKPHDRYLWWPVRLAWNQRSSTWFKTHGWQVGWDGIEQRVYGRTVHLGPLKLMFGRKGGG